LFLSKLYKIYVRLGLIGYKIVLPLMRIFIRRTERAYVMLQDGDNILMTKNWLSNGLWALPGGGIRAGESREQAVIREVKEEINVDLRGIQFELVARGIWQTDRLDFKYTIFKAQLNPGVYEANGHEITNVEWIPTIDLNVANTSQELLAITQ